MRFASGRFRRLHHPAWLSGPIFDKELRVSSRRKRNYLVRVSYLALLTLVVVLVWFSTVDYTVKGSSSYISSRMARAGIAIFTSIVLFQFFAMQVLAVVSLSNSISDEIYHQTLGLLMTTPITSVQIVLGKLFSKQLQLILLIGISLPLLAIIRVFGGIPWDFLISSLCVTLTAMIFAGSLSLTFSVSGRRAYAVIVKTGFVLGVLYGFFPALLGATFYDVVPREILMTGFCYLNPFGAIFYNVGQVMSGMSFRGVVHFYWPIHCMLMLVISALLLVYAVRVVRRAALRQATGQLHANHGGSKWFRKPFVESPFICFLKKCLSRNGLRIIDDSTVRPVKGSPVVWKELRTPFVQGGKRLTVDALVIAVLVLMVTYVFNVHYLRSSVSHMAYAGIFMALGLVYTLVVAATSITMEKESRSWPLLLTTSLEDGQLLMGKAIGVFRRCLSVWLFLGIHVVMFTLIGWIHPIGLLHTAMIALWIIVFLTGTGIYFSSRFRRTTTAVIMNIAVAFFLWGVLPMVLGGVGEILHKPQLFQISASANPFVQIDRVMDGAGGVSNAEDLLGSLNYRWPMPRMKNAYQTTKFVFLTMVIYSLAGVFFMWRAKRHFRRKIF